MQSKLEPQTEALLQELGQRGMPPVHILTPTQARESRHPVFMELGGPPAHIQKVENIKIEGPEGEIPLRIYTPDGSGPFPALLYFHGGGWVIGTLDTHDSLCRAMANGAACKVVSVDYRLAPEHKFPAAVEDVYAATKWASDNAHRINVDPARIAVGGDSAGGNLAAVVSLLARDRGGPPLVYQLLIYPVINLASFDTTSYREHGEGYILTTESMKYYRGHYIKSEEDAHNPYASPILAPDLAGLPSALVLTAEIDVLTDESEVYAKRLAQAGVSTKYTCYEGVIHPFLSFFGVLDRARDAMAEANAELRTALAR